MTAGILVVDDNAATRRMVCAALSRSGHAVLEATDGRSALALMQREQPAVVLLDLRLPDADGFTLVGELRRVAAGGQVAILAFSGFVSDLDEARISSVGFDDIIAKPISPGRLVPLIEALTERQWGDNSPPREVAVKHVALFATPATVASRAFQRELAFQCGVDVTAFAC